MVKATTHMAANNSHAETAVIILGIALLLVGGIVDGLVHVWQMVFVVIMGTAMVVSMWDYKMPDRNIARFLVQKLSKII